MLKTNQTKTYSEKINLITLTMNMLYYSWKLFCLICEWTIKNKILLNTYEISEESRFELAVDFFNLLQWLFLQILAFKIE